MNLKWWRLLVGVAELRERVSLFKCLTKTQKHIFLSVISTYGVKVNEHSLGLVDNNFDRDILFEP